MILFLLKFVVNGFSRVCSFMISCLLCGKKYSTQRGLSSHLTRVHDVRDQKQRFSLYVMGGFFPFLEKRSWTKAEAVLEQIRKERKETEWMLGYLLALEGMISALKDEGSHEPYIFSLRECSYKKLQQVKKTFSDFNKKLATQSDFDAGYFQAWNDFTHYMMNSKI